MGGYLYEQMTGDRFQELCQALLTVIFPGVRCFPVGQADGGRDAALGGTIFQAKWTRYPDRTRDPVRWLARAVSGERPKIARLHDLGARRYVLMTNVLGTAALESGQIDQLDVLLAEMFGELRGLEVDVWWRDTLDRHLEPQVALQALYPEILSGRHVAGLALARLAHDAGADEAGRGLSESAVRVADADARFLGVHPAVPLQGGGSEQPGYVPRDADSEVDAVLTATAAGTGSFALLVGGPCAGKTRSAFEAIQRGLPDWWLVHPASGVDIRALLSTRPRPTVVWLDEIQRYLGGIDGLTKSTVLGLLRSGAPMALIGTIWPDLFQRYTHRPAGSEDLYWRERSVLRLARIIDIAPEFSPGERDRAVAAARSDLRLREPLDSRYGFTQALAGAPQLVRRWQDAEFAAPHARAVITAAVDARRVGIQGPLSTSLLRDAAPGYLSSAQRATAPANWLDQALSYATEPLLGTVAVIEPVDAGMGITAGYIAADYLADHGSRIRRPCEVPPSAWAAYGAHLEAGPDLLSAGRSARARGLLKDAESLFRKAVTTAEGIDAYGDLSQLLKDRGESDLAGEMLTQWAATAKGDSRLNAANYLHLARRDEEAVSLLRAAIADGDTDAYMELAEILRWSDPEQALEAYREALAAGDEEARIQVALLLGEADRDDEADEVLSAYPRTGSFKNEPVRIRTALLLDGQGRHDEALSIARELAEEGRFLGYQVMGQIMSSQGRTSEAIDALYAAVQRGDTSALDSLARALVDADCLVEAEAVYRAAASYDAGPHALEGLAYFLADRDRPDEAISFLRQAVLARNMYARAILGDILEDQCRDAEAEQVWREAIAAGDSDAWIRLGLLILDFDHNNDSGLEVELIDMSRADEAIRVWQKGIQEGVRGAIRFWLGRLLQLCGRLDEAEQMWRQALPEGDDEAMSSLAEVLELQRLRAEGE